jgi:hypothetical protein
MAWVGWVACVFDVQSGDVVWHCEGLRGAKGDLAYSSPMIDRDLCVAIGGFSGPGLAFRIKGTPGVASPGSGLVFGVQAKRGLDLFSLLLPF